MAWLDTLHRLWDVVRQLALAQARWIVHDVKVLTSLFVQLLLSLAVGAQSCPGRQAAGLVLDIAHVNL